MSVLIWQLSQRSRLFGHCKILVFTYLLQSFSVPFTANFRLKNKIKPNMCKPLVPKNKMPNNKKIAVFGTKNKNEIRLASNEHLPLIPPLFGKIFDGQVRLCHN